MEETTHLILSVKTMSGGSFFIALKNVFVKLNNEVKFKMSKPIFAARRCAQVEAYSLSLQD